MSETTELKPCPFCGQAVTFVNVSGSYGYYPPSLKIQCCHTLISAYTEKWELGKGHSDATKEARAELAAKWNTRAAQEQK